ncbi:MAG: DUF4270 domain-containing protein [Marinilabiliales bacterium]|nr:DUF4270 domain-containing protein [Marinilabiliales bacterium]
MLLTLLSCRKEPYEIGIDILPPTDTLSVYQTDTVTVIAYTELQDSIRTDEFTFGMVGAIMDPVFGKTTASIYTQVRLSTEGVTFGENPVLDSLVLVALLPRILRRHEHASALESMGTEPGPYQRFRLLFVPDQLKAIPFCWLISITSPGPHDSVLVLGYKVAPHLRINLSNNTNYLGNKILSAPRNVLTTNEEFIKFFKGLRIEALPVNRRRLIYQIQYGRPLLKDRRLLPQLPTRGDSLRFDMVIDGRCRPF